MKLLRSALVSILLLALATSSAIMRSEVIDSACNCDHCDEAFLNESEDDDTDDPPVSGAPNKEDADGDGNWTICARDRDYLDRSFPSVCHMHCFNRCSRFDVSVVREGNMKKYITSVYRTNYYKLRDGSC